MSGRKEFVRACKRLHLWQVREEVAEEMRHRLERAFPQDTVRRGRKGDPSSSPFHIGDRLVCWVGTNGGLIFLSSTGLTQVTTQEQLETFIQENQNA